MINGKYQKELFISLQISVKGIGDGRRKSEKNITSDFGLPTNTLYHL